MNKTATTVKFPCPLQQFGLFSLFGIKPAVYSCLISG